MWGTMRKYLLYTIMKASSGGVGSWKWSTNLSMEILIYWVWDIIMWYFKGLDSATKIIYRYWKGYISGMYI